MVVVLESCVGVLVGVGFDGSDVSMSSWGSCKEACSMLHIVNHRTTVMYTWQ